MKRKVKGQKLERKNRRWKLVSVNTEYPLYTHCHLVDASRLASTLSVLALHPFFTLQANPVWSGHWLRHPVPLSSSLLLSHNVHFLLQTCWDLPYHRVFTLVLSYAWTAFSHCCFFFILRILSQASPPKRGVTPCPVVTFYFFYWSWQNLKLSCLSICPHQLHQCKAGKCPPLHCISKALEERLAQ